MKRFGHYSPLLLIAVAVILSACSAKKNTAGSRFWQAFNTRYNVYYNGITHYNEQIKKLEGEYEDDYSQRLFIHPAEAYSNPKAPQPSTNFNRTIEKMQKAISLHSIKKKPKRKNGKGNDPKYKEWLKRDEYNPFLHNAWYLMGKAQYMKGDFLSSAATFHYIARHFSWKPDLVAEAQVWEVLSYCAMGWTTEADNVLAHIHLDKIENKRIRSLGNLAFADYFIKDKEFAKAIPYLAIAAKNSKGAQKVRLNFLLGQLYEDNNQKDLAYQAFKKAGSSNSSSYRTKFNARIKQSAVYSGSNINSEVKSLRTLARFDRNKEYLDQIYYAIGNLYLTKQDTAHAVESYVMAAKKSTRNGIDKAISQLTLGGIYFNQHKYDLAQPCYAEAIPVINEDYPNYKLLKKRSDVLDELAVYSQNVTLQDSLLRLSAMTPDQQKAVIKKIIDELKKKEKEDAENAAREDYLAKQNSKGNQLSNKNNSKAPTAFQINNDKSWYFYNTATKNAGRTAFQQLWGNRKLEDDWRRRNKASYSTGDESNNEETAQNEAPQDTKAQGNDSTKVDKKAQQRSEDPHYEEYYLKQIPKTDEEKKNSNDVIQEGLYNMGIILKDKMEDYDAAAAEFNELLKRYPDNIYRLDTYYNMYLMYMRSKDYTKAETFRQLILTNFAESKYGQAMTDPNYMENLKNMANEQEEMYAKAYQDYLDNNNEAVHQAYATMMKKYPLSKIMPKFMFIDALAYVTQKDYDHFKSTLKDLLKRYPETDITPTASSIVKQLNQGRKPNSGAVNARGMLWTMRLGNDSTPQDIEKHFTPFKEEHDKPQLFLLVYSVDSVSPNQLLYEVAKHNFSTFKVKDYDLEQMTFGELGLLAVKGFANYDEVTHYRTVFEQDKSLNIPAGTHQVLISEGNFNLLLNEGRSFAEYFQYLDTLNTKKVEGLVPPTATDDAQKAKPKANDKKAEKTATKSVKKGKPEAAAKPQKEDKDKATAKQPAVAKPDADKEQPNKAASKPEAQPKNEENAKPAAKADTEPAETTAKQPQPNVAAKTDTAPANNEDSEQKAEQSRDEKDNAKEQAKLDKQKQKEEKERLKQAENERKQLEKQKKDEEKRQKDSIKQAQKDKDNALKLAQKQHSDSIKNAQKQQKDAIKQKQKEREQQAKQKEEQRKQQLKEREQQRKLKIEERKQRAKEQKQKRKDAQKKRKEEADARKKAQKEKQEEREQQRKEKASGKSNKKADANSAADGHSVRDRKPKK